LIRFLIAFFFISTPLIMGFLADRYGIVPAFYALGALGLACAVLIAWMRRWAFRPA
jgi:fucose permease